MKNSERIAEILIPEGINKRGVASTIETAYGRKTRAGIADLIDRETAAPDLLKALKEIEATWKEWSRAFNAGENGPSTAEAMHIIRERARAAINKAEGE